MKVGIAGLGTVGVGVFKILQNNSGLIQSRTNDELVVSAVSSRDKNKDRGINTDNVKWYDNCLDMVNDDDIDIIIELIGGSSGVAYELCKAALSRKKHVVTANKALIATYGHELSLLAEENNVSLKFEASVAGGVPIVKAVMEGLAANNINKISGILNGTCNYILTAMYCERRQFDDVLEEAQQKGYAETPPDLDIEGTDTAHKLAILTSLAYGTKVNLDAVFVEGIKNISLDDIDYAHEMEYSIKLLGIANKTDNGIEQRVHPCLIPHSCQVSSANWVLNAIQVECDYLGNAYFSGAGAGEGATASSVVADLMDIAVNRTSNPFGYKTSDMVEGKFLTIDQHEGEYYIRSKVKNVAGVLSSITSILSENDISAEKVLQKPDALNNNISNIAFTTNKTFEYKIIEVLEKIEKMGYVLEKPHMIRIEEI